MNPKLQQIFDSVPEEEPRSRLEPYREMILRWRRQGRTYRRIRQLLAEKCSVSISSAMIHKFVQSRSRPRKPPPELDAQPALPPQPAAAGVHAKAELPATERKRLSSEEKAAQVEFIRSLRKKPVVVPEPSQPLFDYDPDKPLTINQPRKD